MLNAELRMKIEELRIKNEELRMKIEECLPEPEGAGRMHRKSLPVAGHRLL
jgi:hypothetical protein